MPDTRIETPPAAFATTSLRIIATALVFAGLYYASSILITLICALFIAFVLDPGVVLLERIRIPRWLGALVIVLLALLVLYLIVYLVYGRAFALILELPSLLIPIQRFVFRMEP